MRHTYLAAIVFVVVLVGVVLYTHYDKDQSVGVLEMGSYAYSCTGGVEFKMIPTADMSSITLIPGSNATFVQSTLQQNKSVTNEFVGESIVFTGAGESVHVVAAGQTLDCNPVPSADVAPFNFGDAAEGAGTAQDVAAAVDQNIVGVWQSTDDPLFVREFKTGGVQVDYFDGEADATGTWKTFTKTKPLTVAFPLDAGVTYVQISDSKDTSVILNFRVNKLTPESLEMTYMERGNTLSFQRVQ